jgi:hypothetical protein
MQSVIWILQVQKIVFMSLENTREVRIFIKKTSLKTIS